MNTTPWHACNPSASMLLMENTSPASFVPLPISPNSAACLMQLVVSSPALPRQTTLAPLACADTSALEKSVVPGKA